MSTTVKDLMIVHHVKIAFDDTWTEEDMEGFVSDWLNPSKFPKNWDTNGVEIQHHRVATSAETKKLDVNNSLV